MDSVDNRIDGGDTAHTVRAEKSIVRKPIIAEIEHRIYTIRGAQRVMLDEDLAWLYGVPTKSLNLAVKRNINRFPPDFMFQLTKSEYDSLRFQIETLKKGRGRHRKYMPYVFTEHGVAMLSGVLNSPRAIHVNILIMRAFVRMRQVVAASEALTRLVREIGKKVGSHGKTLLKHQEDISAIIEALDRLMNPPRTPVLGFVVDQPEEGESGSHRRRGRGTISHVQKCRKKVKMD